MANKNTMLILFVFLFISHVCFSQSGFTDIAQQAGISYQHDGFPYGGGIAAGDFNNDGYVDIYITNGKGHPNHLYINNQNETFTETAQTAGVADTLEGMASICGDIDNDGDMDLFVANHNGENKLFLNDSTAHFEDVSQSSGIAHSGPATGAAFVDYDNDGNLDLYVLNHSQDHIDHSNILYRNNGDGTFSDVSKQSYLNNMKTSLSVGFFDSDNDGYLDVYLVNEYHRDEIYHNNGDGTFTNRSNEMNIPSGGGMGVDFSDFDNDGDMDIYVSNLYRDFLFENDGNGFFTEKAAAVGIQNLTMGWGVNFADFDNDGDEDLYVVNGAMIWPSVYDETNVYFRNNGNGFFVERAEQLGLDSQSDSRASACADINNDGYVDVMVLNIDRGDFKLYKNNGGSNNWITLKLIGTESNCNAIGTRVELRAGSNFQTKEITAGGSYSSMHGLDLCFGLKDADVINRIYIRWPSGKSQELLDIEPNQILTINEPGEKNPTKTVSNFILYQNYPNPFNSITKIPYKLQIDGAVQMDIVDITGQIVRQFDRGFQTKGEYFMNWGGEDQQGDKIPSGIYFYYLSVADDNGKLSYQAKKMVFIK